MTTAETTTTAAPAAPANSNGTVTKTAKAPVRMQFLCEKRQIEFIEEIPASLIGVEAVLKPAMPKMFELTLAPIVMKHAAEALAACEDKCSSKGCEKDATTIVATPMSVSCLLYFPSFSLLLSLTLSLFPCLLCFSMLPCRTCARAPLFGKYGMVPAPLLNPPSSSPSFMRARKSWRRKGNGPRGWGKRRKGKKRKRTKKKKQRENYPK